VKDRRWVEKMKKCGRKVFEGLQRGFKYESIIADTENSIEMFILSLHSNNFKLPIVAVHFNRKRRPISDNSKRFWHYVVLCSTVQSQPKPWIGLSA